MDGILNAAFSFFKTKVQPEEVDLEAKRDQELITQIQDVCRQMKQSDVRFSLAEDNALIEACIYEKEALKARYQYLLRCARERGVTRLPYEAAHIAKEEGELG